MLILKSVLMRKLITLVSVVFAFCNMSAQLKVHSNGNVSIKTTDTPNAALAIGGAGDATQSLFVKSNNLPAYIERDGVCTESGVWNRAILIRNFASDTRMLMGVSSAVGTKNSLSFK